MPSPTLRNGFSSRSFAARVQELSQLLQSEAVVSHQEYYIRVGDFALKDVVVDSVPYFAR
jgi:hypothetical protein